MELLLKDEEDSTTATIIGKAADTLFGIACHELVNEKGEDDKYNVPPAIEKAKNQYHVWRIGYGLRNDFLVKDVYLENRNDEKLFIHDTMSHPTTPAKRVAQPQKEETLKELLNMEIKKKQKRVILASGLLPALYSLDIREGLTRAILSGTTFGDRVIAPYSRLSQVFWLCTNKSPVRESSWVGSYSIDAENRFYPGAGGMVPSPQVPTRGSRGDRGEVLS
ncbi:hypothetical protein ACLB2K_028975 [Fragaria x ananassa]